MLDPSPVHILRIDGKPVAWKRPGQTRGGRRFDPATNKQAKRDIGLLWKAKGYRPHPKEVPLVLALEFAFTRPSSHFVGRDVQNQLRDDAPLFHVGVPDGDNLAKLVKDALKGIAWHDDAQVCRLIVDKTWTVGAPYTNILVAPR